MQNREEVTPTEVDVLCGTGLVPSKHPGNLRFRSIVEKHLDKYADGNRKKAKMNVSKLILEELLELGTRFLKRDPSNKGWYVADVKVGKDKISHCLRDLKREREGQRSPMGLPHFQWQSTANSDVPQMQQVHQLPQSHQPQHHQLPMQHQTYVLVPASSLQSLSNPSGLPLTGANLMANQQLYYGMTSSNSSGQPMPRLSGMYAPQHQQPQPEVGGSLSSSAQILQQHPMGHGHQPLMMVHQSLGMGHQQVAMGGPLLPQFPSQATSHPMQLSNQGQYPQQFGQWVQQQEDAQHQSQYSAMAQSYGLPYTTHETQSSRQEEITSSSTGKALQSFQAANKILNLSSTEERTSGTSSDQQESNAKSSSSNSSDTGHPSSSDERTASSSLQSQSISKSQVFSIQSKSVSSTADEMQAGDSSSCLRNESHEKSSSSNSSDDGHEKSSNSSDDGKHNGAVEQEDSSSAQHASNEKSSSSNSSDDGHEKSSNSSDDGNHNDSNDRSSSRNDSIDDGHEKCPHSSQDEKNQGDLDSSSSKPSPPGNTSSDCDDGQQISSFNEGKFAFGYDSAPANGSTSSSSRFGRQLDNQNSKTGLSDDGSVKVDSSDDSRIFTMPASLEMEMSSASRQRLETSSSDSQEKSSGGSDQPRQF